MERKSSPMVCFQIGAAVARLWGIQPQRGDTMTRNDLIRSLVNKLQRRAAEIQEMVRTEFDEFQRVNDHTVGDAGDRGIESHASELTSRMAESESRELADIEEALDRLRDGTFGDCEDCGKSIPMNRLQVVPHARRCVRCQKASENSQLMAV